MLGSKAPCARICSVVGPQKPSTRSFIAFVEGGIPYCVRYFPKITSIVNHTAAYEKLGRYQITADGVPLGRWDESENNPYLGAFKVLAHARDVETALSFYGAFQKILDRLPDGAKFTGDEIQDWLQLKTVGPASNEKKPQMDRAPTLRDIRSFVIRMPELSGSAAF